MKKTETEQILEYLKHIYESINGPLPKAGSSGKEPSLAKRVDSLDKKVDTLDKKVGGLGRKFVGLEKKVDGLAESVGKLDDRVDGLAKSVDKLDDRVSEVQLGLATLAVSTTAQFEKIDERFVEMDGRFDEVDLNFKRIDARFDRVDGRIEVARIELGDHIDRIHSELTGRIIDLEVPGPGGRGGSPSGSGGVPLAS